MSQDYVLSTRKILATNLKNLRIKSKIRREELSLALGFDNSYISKLEKYVKMYPYQWYNFHNFWLLQK